MFFFSHGRIWTLVENLTHSILLLIPKKKANEMVFAETNEAFLFLDSPLHVGSFPVGLRILLFLAFVPKSCRKCSNPFFFFEDLLITARRGEIFTDVQSQGNKPQCYIIQRIQKSFKGHYFQIMQTISCAQCKGAIQSKDWRTKTI